jgi:hypothetical protein
VEGGQVSKPIEIFRCEECSCVFDHDVRKDNDAKWGHICKAKNFRRETRCESYLDKYVLSKEDK